MRDCGEEGVCARWRSYLEPRFSISLGGEVVCQQRENFLTKPARCREKLQCRFELDFSSLCVSFFWGRVGGKHRKTVKSKSQENTERKLIRNP